MKKMICVLVLLVLAGCSGLITRGGDTVAVERNAIVAKAQIEAAATRPFTTLTATQPAELNRGILVGYYQRATMNPFEWLFSKDKTILVNSTYWVLLSKTAALMDEAPVFFPSFSSSDWNDFVVKTAGRIIDVQKAKDGQK
jgi:hypothetical protein